MLFKRSDIMTISSPTVLRGWCEVSPKKLNAAQDAGWVVEISIVSRGARVLNSAYFGPFASKAVARLFIQRAHLRRDAAHWKPDFDLQHPAYYTISIASPGAVYMQEIYTRRIFSQFVKKRDE